VDPVDRRDDGGREAAERFESDEAISSPTISFSLLALDYCDDVARASAVTGTKSYVSSAGLCTAQGLSDGNETGQTRVLFRKVMVNRRQ
jgi:hypothetical protein